MISIEKYSVLFKVADWLLSPVMRVISGAPLEAPQEVHNWNVQNISPKHKNEIKKEYSASISGSYKGYLGKSHGGVGFHFPIFGAWKEYVVFKAETEKSWHLGWIVEGMKKDYFQVCKLILHTPNARALKPAEGVSVLFFALDENGKQIALSIVGEGIIGDGKYGHIRLL